MEQLNPIRSKMNGSSPPEPPPMCVEHAKRLEHLEDVVGRPSYLDDPGHGIARAVGEIYGQVTTLVRIGRWLVGAVVLAVAVQVALGYVARIRLAPPIEARK